MIRQIFLALLVPALMLANSHAAGQPTDPAAALAKSFPQFKPVSITPSPVPGLYEVVLEGDRILYFSPETGHILSGSLWTAESRNLTAERTEQLRSEKYRKLPLDKALKLGAGKQTVVVVTDPDCPYCRKGDDYLSGRSDITSYIFFLPLPMHPNAAQKAAYILSAADPGRVYGEVMSGLWDDKPLPPFTDNGRLAEQRKVVESLGVTSTPAYWINGTYVPGADIERIKSLLGPPPAAASGKQ